VPLPAFLIIKKAGRGTGTLTGRDKRGTYERETSSHQR